MLYHTTMFQKLEQLSTSPRHQEEEYEYSSDFLEWFYHNVIREHGYEEYPALYLISKDTKYNTMCELARKLINCKYAAQLDNETLISQQQSVKEWLLESLKSQDLQYL
jgi:hypothetical protein